MFLLYCFVYFFTILVAVLNVVLGIYLIEYVYCAYVRRQPPLVFSNKKSRQIVIEQIKTYYNHAKNICEIGSGTGSFARQIARNTKSNIDALENLPCPAFLSKMLDFLTCSKNKTIWCDAFKYLDCTNKKFDVAVAYLGPDDVYKILKYKHKIDVFISLDFQIKNVKPTRTIDAGPGYTMFNHKKYPHKLFIYEFRK